MCIELWETQNKHKPNNEVGQIRSRSSFHTAFISRLTTSPDPQISSPFCMDPKLPPLACSLYCLEINCLRARTRLCLGHNKSSNYTSTELNCPRLLASSSDFPR